jgi:phosphonate transport system ATP-binding protein
MKLAALDEENCSAHKNGGVTLPQLALKNVGVQRNGKWLFRKMSWEIPRGKFIAVVGPSGVGKSSLLSCLAGMVEPSEGEINYSCRQNCLHAPCDFQKRIGIIFQDFLLIENSSVLTNVLCGRLGRYPWWKTLVRFPREDRKVAYCLLHDLGLDGYVHRWVAEVSGGEQQRTAIARALFQEPEVILADEPVSNLDSYFAGRTLGILRQHTRQHQRTVLCVLHNAELVERFADYVLSLDPQNPEGWKIRPVQRA